jgi:transcriptional regulator with XRE-family HTH domain
MLTKEIISKIKERRKFLKITQKDLSEISGISLASIKNFEREKANLSTKNFFTILDSLGFSISLVERISLN